MAEVVIGFGSMLAPENFNGEKCNLCKEPIYGEGFRIVVTSESVSNPLPKFKDTDLIVCQPCANAAKEMKW